MSENAKGTEPHEWTDQSTGMRFRAALGGVEVLGIDNEWRSYSDGGVTRRATSRELARLAASNRALVEQNERLRKVPPLSHADLCALSQTFNGAWLNIDQRFRINEWLKANFAAALSPDPAPSAEPGDGQ